MVANEYEPKYKQLYNPEIKKDKYRASVDIERGKGPSAIRGGLKPLKKPESYVSISLEIKKW